jgi:hypothetical protein
MVSKQGTVGGRQVLQALQQQPERYDEDQETCRDEKRKVAGYQILLTKVRAYTDWILPKTVQAQRGRYMLVVCRASGPDPEGPLPPLQPVERSAESPLESGGEGDGLESRQMPTGARL